MGLTSDSSSDSEDDNKIFQAICDPTMSANYGTSTNKMMCGSHSIGHTSSSNKIEPVTGDDFIDSAIHSLKRNIADLAVQRFNKAPASTEGRSATVVPARLSSHKIVASNSQRGGALVPIPYAVKRMAQVLDSQITVRSHNKKPKHSQQAATNDSLSNTQSEDLPAGGGDERLQLLQSVAYDPNLPQQDLNQTNNEWLRKVKKRYNPCYYSSEEEEIVESRCRALALPATLIASGGLKSIYAERKNTNPQKVQRARLCKGSKNGVLLIAPLPTCAASKAGPEAQNVVSDAGNTNSIPKKALSKTLESGVTALQSETGSVDPTIKKVKKKARKRGPKKKKNVESMNGNCVHNDSQNVAVES